VETKSEGQKSWGQRYLSDMTYPGSTALGTLFFLGSNAGKELGKQALKGAQAGAVTGARTALAARPLMTKVVGPTLGTVVGLNISRQGLEDEGVENAGTKALLGHAELGLRYQGDSLANVTDETAQAAKQTAAKARHTVSGIKKGKAKAAAQLNPKKLSVRNPPVPRKVREARAINTAVRTGAKGAVRGAGTALSAGKTAAVAGKGLARAGSALGKGLLTTGAATAAAGSLVEAAAKSGLLPSAIEGASNLLGGDMDIDRDKMAEAAEEFNKTDVFGVEVPVALDPFTSVAMADNAIEALEQQNVDKGFHGEGRLERAKFVSEQLDDTLIGSVPGAANTAGAVYLVGDAAADATGAVVDAGVGAVTGTGRAVSKGAKALLGMGVGLFG